MPTQSVQRPGVAGATLTFHDATTADKFLNDGEVMIVVTNADVAPVTLTLDDDNTPIPEGSSANYDAALTIGAGLTRVCGPFPRSRFNDENDLVTMTWSSIPDTGGMSPVILLTWAVIGL